MEEVTDSKEFNLSAFVEEWHSKAEYVIAHTSGSTGKPKEIKLRKSDMILSARRTNAFFGISCDSVLYCPLSIDYIAGKMMVVRAIDSGALLSVEKPSMYPLNSYRGTAIDLLPIVPSQIPGLIPALDRVRVKNIIVGGAGVSEKMEHDLMSTGVNCFATYGMTETCSHIALRAFGEAYFKMLPGFTGSVDEDGCLIIESKDMSFGILATNDIVDMISPQEFRVLGRRDNVIISGGEKLFAEEIESAISSLMGDNAFYVASRRSDKWGEEAVVVVEKGDECLCAGKLLEACRNILPRHHVPKDIVFVDIIDRTPTGKIRRRKLL